MSATLTPPGVDHEAARPMPALDVLVRRARRRMRLNRALATAGPALLAAGGMVALWFAIGRFVLLPPVDAWVAGIAAGIVVLVVAAAAAVPIPDRYAAWAADRWLATHDAFSTAIELRGTAGEGLGAAQLERAEASAAGFRRFPQGPRVPARSLAVGAGAVLLAAVLGLVDSPMDELRERRAIEAATIEEQAERLREEAEELAASPDPDQQQLSERLEALADELERAGSAEEALEELDATRAELERTLEKDLASQRTALTGLARELGRQPLAAGDSVRQQLDQLASELAGGELSAEEQQELAERLRELADALAAAQPELSDALREAGESLADGDTGAAAGAVARASGSVGEALRHLASQEATAGAADAVDGAADAIRDAQQAQGEGQGQGQGQGEGEGQGAGQGQGQGQGEGEGQGAGQGQGQGQGEGQTQGGGGGGNPTGEQGQGGANTGTGTSNAGEHGDLDLQTVYDPPERINGDGDDLHLGGQDSGEGDETTVGSGEGPGGRNETLVPYLEVLAEYLDRATRTIEREGYPVELRDLVRSYFDRLSVPE